GNNAPKIKELLQLSGVTDTYVKFEYLVPYNMKRIDCILYVRNSQNQANLVHIELKQWDNKGFRDTDCE
ncbi:ATP/GTP-binding protein, partial [Bacteroides thetaiotaomicron]|nr:ATP/GTP-binding protein [Bacteroides thetaiotaomicron]